MKYDVAPGMMLLSSLMPLLLSSTMMMIISMFFVVETIPIPSFFRSFVLSFN
jgi:hypothetical protein